MNLGFQHATLAVLIIKEGEESVKRLFRIVQHVSERPALTVLKKIITGNGHSGHFNLHFDVFHAVQTFIECTSNKCTYNYCMSIDQIGKSSSPIVLQYQQGVAM
jgi:hypothetical protein